MRFTTTAKYFIGFLLSLAALVLLILFLIGYYPKITGIAGACVLLIFMGFILFISGSRLFDFLNERADHILAVYTDAPGRALHIFSGFSAAGGRFATNALRSIQYYCVLTDTQKTFYTVLFSHPLKPLSGRSGYEGFLSVEETIMQHATYKAALADYAEKAGRVLQPFYAVKAGSNNHYEISMDTNTYRIVHSKGPVSNTFRLSCFDEAGKLLWKKKL